MVVIQSLLSLKVFIRSVRVVSRGCMLAHGCTLWIMDYGLHMPILLHIPVQHCRVSCLCHLWLASTRQHVAHADVWVCAIMMGQLWQCGCAEHVPPPGVT